MMEVCSNDVDCWIELQCTLRNQLKPYDGSRFTNLIENYQPLKKRLEDVIKRTTSMGESNSMLIIGPRGSGKSTLMSSVVNSLFKDKSVKDNLILINLNGLVHTDDNIALKDIMDQLQIHSEDQEVIVNTSFAEKLVSLLDALRSGSKRSKSILFVLDEFDLFCSHKEQTLLYNLFDVAQSQQSPICVVGMSCRPDILSKLENRVRSRFSHQQICLFNQLKFEDFVSLAKQFLSLPENFSDQGFKTHWNSGVVTVIEQQAVLDILKNCYNCSLNLRDLKRFLWYPVMYLDSVNPELKAGHFIEAFATLSKDSKIVMMYGLSVLELSLIITMMHLTELYDGEPFNFEMVYHEYKKFLQKRMNMRNLDKAVVLKALEHLLDINLVKEVGEPSLNKLKRFVPLQLLLEPNQIKENISRYRHLPSQLHQWVTSPLIE